MQHTNMRKFLIKTGLDYCAMVAMAIILSNAGMTAHAQGQPVAAVPADTNAPTPAQRALALLKPAADKLSAAKTFTFKTYNMVEVPSPVGQLINYFFTSEVAVERPNKLASKRSGDGPAFDLYYDGKQFSSADGKLGLYAQMDAPATLDELIPLVLNKAGVYFPYADMLYSDVYGILTKGLTV